MTIAVLDFGGQYCHLIARRVRDLGVDAHILPHNTPAARLQNYCGIILSGGPRSVYDADSPRVDPAVFSLAVPVLGICYGHQLMAKALEGVVRPGRGEYGFATLDNPQGTLFDNGQARIVWMSHGDIVHEVPAGFLVTAATEDCPVAAMENPERRFYGLQFHPEVTHTERGADILDRFLTVCGCDREWRAAETSQLVRQIQEGVGDNSVFMLLSGGVDSTVAFALLNRALGRERVYGLHIDNGLMRRGESEEVREALEAQGYDNFHVVDASETFLRALEGVVDPEEKRNIIGRTFIEVQREALHEVGLSADTWLLGQGTIYPDTIESQGTKHADLIKTHHNRIPIIAEMIEQGRVVEPLAHLYKDEVRELGAALGLPHYLLERHPFPGPGLGIRCICSHGDDYPAERARVERQLRALLEDDYWFQLLPIKSVGVQGDARSYRHCVLIRKDWNTLFDRKELNATATRITNEIQAINRVLYLVSPEEIPEVAAKEAFVTEERLELLREADFVAQRLVHDPDIWQFPVILLPVGWKKKEAVVLRPVQSKEAMTARFHLLDEETLREIVEQVDVDFVAVDITNKPPATIEWE
ncbi:MAG: glutamine-hydrolyzing GMP synthase [Candidatus Promineifilaceae bacterium]|nr:glutamine-hydrolyzing GMP synthase [Candidatus Promineifilaceae bacterium]